MASIIEDSLCGSSDGAYRTAPPVGGFSCFGVQSLCLEELGAHNLLQNEIEFFDPKIPFPYKLRQNGGTHSKY